jgi:cyanoexosortase A
MLDQHSLNRVFAIIGGGLILLHLLLTWKWIASTDQFVLNVLFWIAIVLLLWHKRLHLNLQSSRFASGLGAIFMGLLFVKSLSLLQTESEFIRLFPAWAALSFGLIASGFRLRQYGREVLIILTLIIPPGTVERLVEWSIGTKIQALIAQSTAFFLHYIGFDVVYKGIEIASTKGIVRVEYTCTGINILFLLLQLSILVQLVFPVYGWRCRNLFPAAILLAWALVTLRVALMVTAIDNRSTFEYWHGEPGSQIFSTAAIVVFACLSHWLLEETPTVANEKIPNDSDLS